MQGRACPLHAGPGADRRARSRGYRGATRSRTTCSIQSASRCTATASSTSRRRAGIVGARSSAASTGRAREQLRRAALAVLTDPDRGVRGCVPTGATRQIEDAAYFTALAQSGDPHDADTSFARDYFRTVTAELAVALECGSETRALLLRRRELDGRQSHRVFGMTDWDGVASQGSGSPTTTTASRGE